MVFNLNQAHCDVHCGGHEAFNIARVLILRIVLMLCCA